MQIKVIHDAFPCIGEKTNGSGLPAGDYCGPRARRSQCTFLPMSCPFLPHAGENAQKRAHWTQ
ncbi:hypothetical protein EV102420_08_02280 [Pseudescherichia vulneris NBRC 102420]|uniref:Uncharacterized protein n=1 Tax=Pseudescherichia vulneris NBRC 102420 TaxID=1115515 RepID=A0A090UYQ6_PSEVU|nr:hypothetical protein EV102420_08_02280 [Pseudescherichia vulneris NBRC 102420]